MKTIIKKIIDDLDESIAIKVYDFIMGNIQNPQESLDLETVFLSLYNGSTVKLSENGIIDYFKVDGNIMFKQNNNAKFFSVYKDVATELCAKCNLTSEALKQHLSTIIKDRFGIDNYCILII